MTSDRRHEGEEEEETYRSLFLALVLSLGVLLVIPNGIDPRIQRPVNFTLLMLAAAGFYISIKLNIFLGSLVIWSSFVSWPNVLMNPQLNFTLAGLIVFYLCAASYDYDRELIYDALIVIAGFNLIFQVMQASGIYFIFRVTNNSLPGLMSNINETSALFALTAPAFFRRNRIWLFPVVTTGLILAHTRQGVVALAVVAAVWALIHLKRRYVLAALAGIFICLSLFHFFVKPFSIDKKRLAVWKTTAKIAMVKPFAGWGFGQYSQVMPALTMRTVAPELLDEFRAGVIDRQALKAAAVLISEEDKQDEAFLQAHNEYAEWLFASGLIGLFWGLTFLWSHLFAGKMQNDRIPFYGLLSSAVVSIFGFAWHIFPLALITTLYIGLIERGKFKEA